MKSNDQSNRNSLIKAKGGLKMDKSRTLGRNGSCGCTVTWHRGTWFLAAVLVVAAALALAAPGRAGVITLTEGTSTVEIDPDSSAGVFDWSIGTTSYLSQQWFWFRNGLDDYDDREYAIDELDLTLAVKPIDNLAIVEYTDRAGRFAIQVTYLLTGSTGLLTSDLAETIRIRNLSDATIAFDFFQYSDFDLGGEPNDSSVVITGGNTVMQTDHGTTAVSLLETVVTGSPQSSEAGIYPATLTKLTDADVDDLNGSTVAVGPANLTWAFGWMERAILPNHDFIISKDKLLTVEPIPEPAGLGLIGLALLGFRKRRK